MQARKRKYEAYAFIDEQPDLTNIEINVTAQKSLHIETSVNRQKEE